MALGKFKLNRNETILICVAIGAGLFAFQRYWKVPHSRENQRLQTEIANIKTEIETNQQILAKFSVGRQPAAAAPKGQTELFAKLSKDNDNFSKVIKQLTLKENTPFIMSLIATEPPVRVANYTKTLISVEAEASFLSIGKFLENLENSSLLTEVESIEISRLTNDMKLCDAKIKLLSYKAGP